MRREEIIDRYINDINEKHNVIGAFICGSYVSGGYNRESDLDTFILVENHEFDMILDMYEGVLFDRIIVDYVSIMEVLRSDSAIGKILSYSFGSANKVILDSKEIIDILSVANSNIKTYGITYKKSPNKPKKVVDNKRYTIERNEDGYSLMKDGVKII